MTEIICERCKRRKRKYAVATIKTTGERKQLCISCYHHLFVSGKLKTKARNKYEES